MDTSETTTADELPATANPPRRPSINVKSSPPKRLSKQIQPAFALPAPVEEMHTYTLCLLGYLQTFSHSVAGTIKEIPLQLDSAIRQVSCGLDWLCVLTDHGRLYSFGTNTYGQLAQGHLQSIAYPKPVCFSVEKRIARVSCGIAHGGFILDNGALFMFGCGSYGRLGTGNEHSQSTPVAVKMSWKDLHAKASALSGQLVSTIPGTLLKTTPSPSPSGDAVSEGDISADSDSVVFSDISCGDRHTLLLGVKTMLSSGKKSVKTHVISFGDGTNGRLGIGSENDQHTGVLVTQFATSIASYVPSFSSICAGASHNAAISTAGEVFTWGNGADGQLGHGSHESEWVPREVESFRGVSMASAKCGIKHTVAVSRTGVVYTWGRGAEGQLGTGAIASSTKAQRIALVLDPLAVQQAQIEAQLATGASSGNIVAVQDTRVLVRSIVARENTTMALDEHSRLFVWGDNTSGQLGLPPKAVDGSQDDLVPDTGSLEPTNRVLTPKQLMYQDLRESKKLASRLRDRMLLSASSSLPRVALTHVDATDRFSVLVFRTKAPTNGFGQGDESEAATLPKASVSGIVSRLTRQRSSHMNDMGGTVTWTFGLTDKLSQKDIPSREAAFYKYMVQYKVHIRVPTPAQDGEDSEEDGGHDSRHRRSSQASPLHNNRRRNSVLAIPPDMRAQLKPHQPESDEDEADSFDARRHGPRSNRPAAEAVKGFNDWLDRHTVGELSPTRSPSRRNSPTQKPLYQFGTAPRFRDPHVRVDADTPVKDSESRSSVRAASATPRAPTTTRKPCPPKSAFGRAILHPSPRGSVSMMRPSRPATASSGLSWTAAVPAIASNQSPPSTSPPAPTTSNHQRLFRQFVAPFGSSVKSRFGPKSPRPNDENQLTIYPERCDGLTSPRSPGVHLGSNAEQFSETITRRMREASGPTPGPGTYDRCGG